MPSSVSHAVRIIACPHPFSVTRDRTDVLRQAGQTVEEHLQAIGFETEQLSARVFIDGEYIEQARWEYAVPSAQQVLTIRTILQGGGGGKDILRMVAMIAVMALAIWVTGGAAAGAFGLTGYFAVGSTSALWLAAGISIVGTLAINALIPPSMPKLGALSNLGDKTSSTLSLTGSANQFAPYGVIPRVYGRHKLFPPLAARPYTEIVGTDQYLRLLFCCGYGPLRLSDFKIGTTELGQFTDVETDIRYGYSTDAPITLYPDDIYEDGLSIKLTAANGRQVRTSQSNARELSVDVAWPTGLVAYTSGGTPGPRTVQVEVAYRLVGGSTWTLVGNTAAVAASYSGQGLSVVSNIAGVNGQAPYFNIYIADDYSVASCQLEIWAGMGYVTIFAPTGFTATDFKTLCDATPAFTTYFSVSVTSGATTVTDSFVLTGGAALITALDTTEASPQLQRRSLRWAVPTAGTYEIGLTRVTADTTDATIRDEVYWTMLRTIQPLAALYPSGMAMVAMRIKATGQLNGSVDQFNCLAESILPDWTGTQWVARPTSNPASVYRNIYQGSANARPVADSRMDLTALQGFHTRCTAKGFAFNAVIDYRTSVRELGRDVLAAGRGTPGLRDGMYSVIEDIAQTIPVHVLTPRNSWGFKGAKTFADLPHAIRMQFTNPDKDWQRDEVFVYADGYTAENATIFDRMEAGVGVTSASQAWKLGRYHLAVLSLRSETYDLSCDFENLIFSRGDLVRVVHDVPLFGLCTARIKAVTVDGSGNALSVDIDDVLTMASGITYGARFQKSTGVHVTALLTTVVGEQSTLTFATAIPSATKPAVGDLALLGVYGTESAEMIVKAIRPGPDLTAQITLLDYAPGVLTADSGVIPPFTSQITLPSFYGPTPPAPPKILAIASDETVMVLTYGSLDSRIVLDLSVDSTIGLTGASVTAQYRPETSTGEWASITLDAVPGFLQVHLSPVEDGITYAIRLRVVSGMPRPGLASAWTNTILHTVVGKSTPPPDVTTFLREGDRLAWAYPDPPIDLAGFQIRRHFGTRTTWADAQPVHDGLITDSFWYFTTLELGIVTYLLSAVDVAGNVSANPAHVSLNLGDILVDNLLFTSDKKTASFPGTITNGSIVATNLVADSTTLFWTGDDAKSFWNSDATLFWSGEYKAMTYLTNILPDADKVPCTIILDLTVAAQAWGLEYRASGSALYWSGTDANLFWSGDSNLFWSGSQGFLPWPGRITDATRQVYEFQLSTVGGPTQGSISKYQIKIDVPDILENIEDAVIAAAGTRLAITKSYRAISNINLTVQNDGNNAITARIEDKGTGGPPLTGGPLIKCFDAAGTAVIGKVDAQLQGY